MDHITTEKMVAYFRQHLGDSDRERLQDHLALCSECSRLYIDLVTFLTEDHEDKVPLSARELRDVKRAWKRFKADLLKTASSPVRKRQRIG